MEQPSASVIQAWNEWSETWYLRYRTDEAIAKLVQNPESAFHPATLALIKRACPDLRGKRILVPSSGDNHAVFAFHLMGANVTSADISENQLNNSRIIAQKHGWAIDFVCEDTMKLSGIASGEYDFVYTSNGVHVWLFDLPSMYRNVHRVLKDGGSYVMFDVHPIQRPFDKKLDVKIVKPYDETGPFGDVPTFAWRIQDFMNAIASSDLRIAQVEEMYAVDGTYWTDDSDDDAPALSKQELEKLCDWRFNPMAALPQWLSVLATK